MSEEITTVEEVLQRKLYTIKVVPEEGSLKDKTDEASGDVIKAKPKYIRRTKPSEKAKTADPNFKPQKFGHLQLIQREEGQFFGGDSKPFTLTVFQNTDSDLFERIEEAVTTDAMHTIIPTASKTMVMNDKLPGLVRNRPAPPHYAMVAGKDGAMRRLQSTNKTESGDYVKQDVILNSVSYFLMPAKVNKDDDAIRYAQELDAIKKYHVTATPEATVVKAKVEATETEDEPE